MKNRIMASLFQTGIVIGLALVIQSCDVFRQSPNKNDFASPDLTEKPLVPTEPAILNEAFLMMTLEEREQHAGERISLNRVRVQQVLSDYTFWVGGSVQRSIPVVLTGEWIQKRPEHKVDIRAGDVLNIKGTLAKTAGAEAALKLSPQERARFDSFRLYVLADTLEKN